MTKLRYLITAIHLLCCGILVSCDVHEFPNPQPKEMEFSLILNYDTNLPLHKVVEYDMETRSEQLEQYSIRYIVKVYNATEGAESREELYHFEFYRENTTQLNTTLVLSILPGNYNFAVWTDYVLTEDCCDLHYNTNMFEEIALQGDIHAGSNDYRDAFRGVISSEVSNDVVEATVDMCRPMAKFNFVTTDIDDFIAKIASEAPALTSRPQQDILNDYTVIFRYHGFMPSSFNMFTNKPVDALTGVSFTSSLRHLNDGNAELGFDYVFVNGTESNVMVSIEVYDSHNNLITNSKAIEVPLMRSKLTTVKARFLTSDAHGGVTLIPDYDGEHNVQLD